MNETVEKIFRLPCSTPQLEGFVVSALLVRAACTLAPSVHVMIPCRFLLGLAVGGASVTVPVYLAEVSPADRRGRMVTQNELMIVTGQFLA